MIVQPAHEIYISALPASRACTSPSCRGWLVSLLLSLSLLLLLLLLLLVVVVVVVFLLALLRHAVDGVEAQQKVAEPLVALLVEHY